MKRNDSDQNTAAWSALIKKGLDEIGAPPSHLDSIAARLAPPEPEPDSPDQLIWLLGCAGVSNKEIGSAFGRTSQWAAAKSAAYGHKVRRRIGGWMGNLPPDTWPITRDRKGRHL